MLTTDPEDKYELELRGVVRNQEILSSKNCPEDRTNEITDNRKYMEEDQSDDTTCGFGPFSGPFLQRFANRQCYVILFGMLGCLFSASYSYFNGIITTVEKRYGIPSRVTGIITIGNDISTLFTSVIVTYYASRSHQPRWIGIGSYSMVLFCLFSALPHLLYGPGSVALSNTVEYGNSVSTSLGEVENGKDVLCQSEEGKCDAEGDSIAAPVLLFIAQFVSGLGGSLYHTLGISYMDDNVKRSKSPLMLSYSYFVRSLGPVLGYLLSSLCLKLYIAPTLTPSIGPSDPRWIGAWWLGWLILGTLIFIFASLITLFPKRLPKVVSKKSPTGDVTPDREPTVLPSSFSDMLVTFKRLFSNPTLMSINLSAVFFIMGAMPFFTFLPKYIEVTYKQSASVSSLVVGSVGLAFSGIGILLGGYTVSIYKPRARMLAAYNTLVGMIVCACVLSFAYLDCPALSAQTASLHSRFTDVTCQDCHCSYVKYTPVCSVDTNTDFISPCHAGCRVKSDADTYGDCGCFANSSSSVGGASAPTFSVTSGLCPVDCTSAFYIFVAVVCAIQFFGATSRTTNFLVGIRCVKEEDKAISMGIGVTLISLAAFIPSPILFGYIIDKSCLIWGKTCTGTANCWIYDTKVLRYTMNFTSAGFIAVGLLFDVAVWYFIKGTQIFDEEIPEKSKSSHTTVTTID